MISKVDGPEEVVRIAGMLDDLEGGRGGAVLIETAGGLPASTKIAGCHPPA